MDAQAVYTKIRRTTTHTGIYKSVTTHAAHCGVGLPIGPISSAHSLCDNCVIGARWSGRLISASVPRFERIDRIAPIADEAIGSHGDQPADRRLDVLGARWIGRRRKQPGAGERQSAEGKHGRADGSFNQVRMQSRSVAHMPPVSLPEAAHSGLGGARFLAFGGLAAHLDD
jgi:hypothetical protein